MNTEKYKIEKIVVSMGLGNLSNNQIQKIKKHFENLFYDYLKDKKEKSQSCTITKCRKSNSKFKIRKGTPCGLKITLRKERIGKFLKVLNEKHGFNKLRYNNNTLMLGIKDHRMLRLQKYNYEAPEYGFNVAIVFSVISARVYNRRINKSKSKYIIEPEVCTQILNAFK